MHLQILHSVFSLLFTYYPSQIYWIPTELKNLLIQKIWPHLVNVSSAITSWGSPASSSSTGVVLYKRKAVIDIWCYVLETACLCCWAETLRYLETLITPARMTQVICGVKKCSCSYDMIANCRHNQCFGSRWVRVYLLSAAEVRKQTHAVLLSVLLCQELSPLTDAGVSIRDL